MAKSSDIGVIRVAQRLGRESFNRYMRAFGFGTPTGVELPGESSGLLRPPSRWSALSLASLSFGQEIGVTALQITTAVAAVANGGYLMKPYLVRAVEDAAGRVVKSHKPVAVRRVLEPRTVEVLTDLLKGTVRNGTGKKAAIPGYTVAGKTGTAQKIDESGRYSMSDHVASFVGFVPASRPALVILVSLDTPRGALNHGGDVAAPVFARVAEDALRHLAVPSEDPDRVLRATVRRALFRHARRLPSRDPRGGRRGGRPGCDARPHRPPGARGRHRRRPPRPGRGAAGFGPGGRPRSRSPARALEPGMVCLLRLSRNPMTPPGRGPMTLADLLARLPQAETTAEPRLPVAHVTHDSRAVQPGSMFVAIRGLAVDGNQFVEAALRKGAAVVVSEAAAPPGVPWVRVPDAREALALLLRRRPGRPGALAPARGRHGDERQDHHRLPHRRRAARARPAGRPAGDRAVPHRRPAWRRPCGRRPSPRTSRRCSGRWWTPAAPTPCSRSPRTPWS